MSELAGYLAVFIGAAIPWIEVLLVVPAGIVAGLAPAPTAAIGAAGNLATLLPLIAGGDRLRTWWQQRQAARRSVPDDDASPAADDDGDDEVAAHGRSARAKRVLLRYGLPGLALLGPLLTGIHAAAVVALTAGAPPRRTAVWCSIGVVIWAAIAAIATSAGLDVFVDDAALPGLGG